MKPHIRVLILIGLLFIVSFCWYLFSTNHSADLQLIGLVDANEVVISSRVTGRIQKLYVEEGQDVKAGQLLAEIEGQDLAEASKAAEATAESQRFKLLGAHVSFQQASGETSNQVRTAAAQLSAAKATYQQAEAQYEHQEAETKRTVALAAQGIASQQQKDQAVTALQAYRAAVDTAKENIRAAEATVKQAVAHQMEAKVAMQTAASTQGEVQQAQALARQSRINLDYTKITAPLNGKINVRAAREGEVVNVSTPIVTITDLTQTWIYAPLPETQSDAVQVGDSLRVVMPSGASLQGRVIAKSAEGDFATQRDVSRRKRDIKTVRLKLLIDNPGMKYVPGMTAEVYIPKSKLVTQ